MQAEINQKQKQKCFISLPLAGISSWHILQSSNENIFVFVVVVVVVLDTNSQIQWKWLERNLGNSSDSDVQLLLWK